MSRKKREKEMAQMQYDAPQYVQGPQVIYGRVPSMMPIAPPAQMIQLTPIVQPIALVPYSTQQQPISTFYEDIDD